MSDLNEKQQKREDRQRKGIKPGEATRVDSSENLPNDGKTSTVTLEHIRVVKHPDILL